MVDSSDLDRGYRGVERSLRREKKRRRRRKMLMTGRSVFTIQRVVGERARKVSSTDDQARSQR